MSTIITYSRLCSREIYDDYWSVWSIPTLALDGNMQWQKLPSKKYGPVIAPFYGFMLFKYILDFIGGLYGDGKIGRIIFGQHGILGQQDGMDESMGTNSSDITLLKLWYNCHYNGSSWQATSGTTLPSMTSGAQNSSANGNSCNSSNPIPLPICSANPSWQFRLTTQHQWLYFSTALVRAEKKITSSIASVKIIAQDKAGCFVGCKSMIGGVRERSQQCVCRGSFSNIHYNGSSCTTKDVFRLQMRRSIWHKEICGHRWIKRTNAIASLENDMNQWSSRGWYNGQGYIAIGRSNYNRTSWRVGHSIIYFFGVKLNATYCEGKVFISSSIRTNLVECLGIALSICDASGDEGSLHSHIPSVMHLLRCTSSR